MTASTGNVPGRIFMSYRREDTAYPAGWLYDRLTGHFARGQVFKDIDSIELGDNFVEVITTAVGTCDVLLALIGDRWLTVTGQDGRRRLDNPDNFVRLEIEAALARDVRVIPILVEGARMPRAHELPASLAKLTRRQALELSPNRFDVDTRRLLRVLERIITEAQEQARKQAEEAAARQRRQVEQMQGQIRERAAAQDWDGVVAASGELAVLDPAAADPDGLVSAARERLTRRREAEEEAARQRRQVEQLQGRIRERVGSGEGVAPRPDAAHCELVLEHMVDEGNLVPFLGSRFTETLSAGLAERFGVEPKRLDLSDIAQYIYVTKGRPDLYRELRQILIAGREPGPVHRYLARLPQTLEGLHLDKRYQLIISTDFDTALEQAFDEVGEPYDLAIYMVSGRDKGKFVHFPYEGFPEPISAPNTYVKFPIGEGGELGRTVIVKTHGAVDGTFGDYRWKDNYVITDDDYINYLSTGSIQTLIPVQILDKLRDSHCLFLGYAVRDWKQRIFLNRVWGGEPLLARSWAVEPDPDILEKEFWARSNVDLYAADLAQYIHQLHEQLINRG